MADDLLLVEDRFLLTLLASETLCEFGDLHIFGATEELEKFIWGSNTFDEFFACQEFIMICHGLHL